MRLIQELRSHLQYKIIVPFLLLTLLVALTGAAVAFLLITGTAQERLNNQLADVARVTSDSLVKLESNNLQFLREMAFAGANPKVGAPAINEALASRDQPGLEKAVDPYFRVSVQREGIRADRMIVFDASGSSLLDWERLPDENGGRKVTRPARDLSKLWFVQRILSGGRDVYGDKYAGLFDPRDSDTNYLFSVAPVVQGDNKVVGGIIIASRLDNALQTLQSSSLAAIITVYQANDGSAFISTQAAAGSSGLAALNMRSDLVAAVRDLAIAQQRGVFDTRRVSERDYQFAYAPLRIRNSLVGLISVALYREYVTGPWSDARLPLIVLTVVLTMAIVGLGIYIARQITQPLQELVETAQAVTGGDLERRSQVRARDEIGILSRSFNSMTEHLLKLYRVVHAEASQRAAIVESITDGVVVCDLRERVLLINKAMRELLDLRETDPIPERFRDIPLEMHTSTVIAFGDKRAADLFSVGERVVRVASAPVLSEENERIGDVYVLQDVTDEVAIDRAKTKFIATISHELRTPLTVLGGSSDLLMRGMVGPLNDDQRVLIEGMRKNTQTMTTLLNNVITIAGLESGALPITIESVEFQRVLDETLWPMRPSITAKGLTLDVQVPDDLPELLADAHQLRNAMYQLIDNARRYTATGGLTIQALHKLAQVQIDISDTGPGIDAVLMPELFTRFTRGSEGINSAERGMGLGLVIARTLVEHQHGQVWLAHTSEDGSTFSITLPCVQPELTDAEDRPSEDAAEHDADQTTISDATVADAA